MIRVVIVDDHGIVRLGLRKLLAPETDMDVVAEASNADELLELMRNGIGDVVVLDITMPGKSGLEVLKELKQLRPKLPVLILTMHGEEQFGLRALRAGASGYLTKDSATEGLIKAIRKVVSGSKYFATSLTDKLSQELPFKANTCLHETLSDREYQVMLLLASGKTVGEAAEKMGLSVKTISTYRARILEKMRLKNNADLTQYALRNRLIE